MVFRSIPHCRICRSANLTPILNLGHQALTGVFPLAGTSVEAGPLELIKCDECHLVQLAHNYELSKLYGENYGYRSGLNQSMVLHLENKVKKILELVELNNDDVVLDIGANDGTTLGLYPNRNLIFIGMDPSGAKFKKYYNPDITLIPDFFSEKNFKSAVGDRKAKIITSIAMFYDLEDPIDFAKQVAACLDGQGVWVFEQSYLPLMIEAMAYDTVCHEHLEYYGLHQIKTILDNANLKLIDVELNRVNGGSFSVTAAHQSSKLPVNEVAINEALKKEINEGYQSIELYRKFEKSVVQHKHDLIDTIASLKKRGANIHGYGASTKGNVVLQYCGIRSRDLECIAEVNEEKFGRVTPGTGIPITSESDSKKMNPTHYLVLPWHFRENIMMREQVYLKSGGKLLFPLPRIEIVEV